MPLSASRAGMDYARPSSSRSSLWSLTAAKIAHRRAVLCAVRLDGADATDRRRIAGDQIRLRLQHGVAAGVDRAAADAGASSARCRSAATSWCSARPATVRKSGSSASSACRATASRCMPEGSGSTANRWRFAPTAPARWKPTTARWRRRRVSSRRCRAVASTPSSRSPAMVLTTTWPISSFRRAMCSSWATTATTPRTAACRSPTGGVGMLPTGNLVGRVNTLVGSWDLGMADKPIWTWPSGLRMSRFFASVH